MVLIEQTASEKMDLSNFGDVFVGWVSKKGAIRGLFSGDFKFMLNSNRSLILLLRSLPTAITCNDFIHH